MSSNVKLKILTQFIGLRLDFGKSSKIIILVPLLTTFGADQSLPKTMTHKPLNYNQSKLVQNTLYELQKTVSSSLFEFL